MSEPTIQEKREALARRDIATLKTCEIYDIYMNGCAGYANTPDEVIDELFKETNIFYM